MRRNYISPEFEYRKVFGTLNMKEESTFFGSKMLEIEDIIELHNQGIIYYQNSNNEQIDLDIERSLNPIVFLSVSKFTKRYSFFDVRPLVKSCEAFEPVASTNQRSYRS